MVGPRRGGAGAASVAGEQGSCRAIGEGGGAGALGGKAIKVVPCDCDDAAA